MLYCSHNGTIPKQQSHNNKTIMQIPEELKPYAHRTLLVVCDSSHALFYSLLDREVSQVGEIFIDYPPKDDVERSSGQSPSGVHFAEENEGLEDEKEKRFSLLLAKELHNRLLKAEFEDLILAAPQERLNEQTQALHPDVLSRIVKTYPKQITKENPIDILKLVQ